MTQEQKKDLVIRLMGAETICRGGFGILDPFFNLKIREIQITNESVKVFGDDWNYDDSSYGKNWAFTEEELRKLRIEDRKRELRETIEIFQKELKELEEEQ